MAPERAETCRGKFRDFLTNSSNLIRPRAYQNPAWQRCERQRDSLAYGVHKKQHKETREVANSLQDMGHVPLSLDLMTT